MVPANFGFPLQGEKQIKKTLRNYYFTRIDRYLQTNRSANSSRNTTTFVQPPFTQKPETAVV